MSQPRAPRVEARALAKRFGATRALAAVSLSIARGEVHALCGENGAGKSTLIKILAGVYPHGAYEGELWVEGALSRFRGVRDAERAGIVVIHQELALVPELSVAENVFLGNEPGRFGLVDRARMEDESRGLLARLGARIEPRTPVRDLGVGEAQLVEIARALRKRAEVLILDEPTAALSDRETTALLALLRELASTGVSLLYVSHRLPEVLAIADRITVLRDGATVATLEGGATEQGELVRHMVGRTLSSVFPVRAPRVEAAPLLKVDSLAAASPARSVRLRDLSFALHPGEVLGIGGLVGAGRSELLTHLYGAWGTRLAGDVELLGTPYRHPAPARSIARGLVLVSEDRKESGLVLEQSAGFNLTLSVLRSLSRHGFVQTSEEQEMQAEMAARVNLAHSRLALPAFALSGGNQQKVVLGRALLSRPRVLMLDEPTRGVDIGARAEIYQLIADQCRAGMGVLLVTSELPELLGLADRILMLVEGRIGGVFSRSEASEEALLRAALPDETRAPETQTEVQR